ncbi:Uncharacterized protein Adt_20298 [Abeliophyllum distichum]|uniref:Uncharacterized protein n=1 Tax=Abeliophyllum distichum TaxID=126358 RepID=A0ABD1SW77_9LAMI
MMCSYPGTTGPLSFVQTLLYDVMLSVILLMVRSLKTDVACILLPVGQECDEPGQGLLPVKVVIPTSCKRPKFEHMQFYSLHDIIKMGQGAPRANAVNFFYFL